MKKLLSIILAALMMLSIGTVAYAHENVDNTFDNYTPQPGQEAPDNWYDPCCYDEAGLLRPFCLRYAENNAFYCKEHKKIFTRISQSVPGTDSFYNPYQTMIECDPYILGGVEYTEVATSYCPYCGDIEIGDKTDNFYASHLIVDGVIYGIYCPSCGGFEGGRFSSFDNNTCRHCQHYYKPDKYYRFVPQDNLDSEFSFIFEETEHLYGDGTDHSTEELVRDGLGFIIDWDRNNTDNEEPAELTCWEKFVQFFVSIGNFFVKLFTWSW